MDKKILVIISLMLCGIFNSAFAQNQPPPPPTPIYKMALGVRFSNSAPAINNSISFKYFLTNRTAVEALISFGDPVAIGVLLEKHKELGPNGLNWFIGGGAYIGFSGTRNIGAQGVVGLDYKIPTLPLNLSLDWKPELNLAKEFSFEPSAIGISARFTF
jgi:hypothetical protein